MHGELMLGGHEVECAVLICDIRGFTARCENMKPRDVVLLLNDYFTRMTHAVQRYGGYVNNFIGDAMIVVFGAIRPSIHAAKPQPKPEAEANRLNASVDDALELPAIAGGNGPIVVGADGQELPALGAPGTDQRLETARQLAKDNPMAMANLVRGWMNN